MFYHVKIACYHIPDFSSPFLPCGTKILFLFAGDVADPRASDLTREKTRVDLVDFSSSYCYLKHVCNSEPLISSVKSDGPDLIAHSTNDRVTRGCSTRLRIRSDGKNQGGVEPASWDHGHLLRVMWRHRGRPKLLQRNGRLGFFRDELSINRCSLF